MSEPRNEKADNPHDTLIKALENVEKMERVLVIYEGIDGCGSFDSDLTLAHSLYLIELLKAYVMKGALRDERT